MKHRWPAIILLAGSIASGFQVSGETVKDIASLIPTSVREWKASGPDAIYDRKTLYDYMDGGAEVFLAFDFRRLLSRKFGNTAQDEIILDIYEMGSPAEAYGLFSIDRQNEPASVGQEASFGFGLLRYWQGRYFISIMTTGDDKKADAAILDLGKTVALKLGPAGPLPDLLQTLPSAGLMAGRTSYFHSSFHLNNRFFVASDNILALGSGTDAVFAEYGEGGRPTGNLLVVGYPDAQAAGAAEASFRKAFLPEAGGPAAVMTENHKWVQTRLGSRFLAAVFDAPSREDAEKLLAAIRFPQE